MKATTEQQREVSPRTQAALQYLRRLKPSEGYAMESYVAIGGKRQVRLKRRNVPLSDEGFEEIVVDRSAGHVVGIRVLTSRGDAGRGIVLVGEDGKPRKNDDGSEVTVRMANASTSTSTPTTASAPSASPSPSSSSSRGAGGIIPSGIGRGGDTSSSPTSSGRTRSSPASPPNTMSDADNELLLKYGLMALGALVALKILFAALNVLCILALPLVYLYACSSVPSNRSFDAKQQLKRVMRGAHLPEEQQPKGFFEQGLNRLAASVTAELATSLGYEVTVTEYFGAAKMASVKVPVANAEYYWVGIVEFNTEGKWRYIGQREIPENRND